MHLSPEQVLQEVERFCEALRAAGVKLTHQRIEIVREVLQCQEHPDAERVYSGVRERVPTVSLDTVYRTLWLLTDLGLITTLGLPRDRVRFDVNVHQHHHFICTGCGSTLDIESSELDSLPVPPAVSRLGQVQLTQVEFRGLCLDCAGQRPQ